MVVKEALAIYFSKHDAAQHAYELGEDLFGVAGSANPDNSTTYKARLKQKLNEKNTH